MVPLKLREVYSDLIAQIIPGQIVGMGAGTMIEGLLNEIAKYNLNIKVIPGTKSLSLMLKKCNIEEISLIDINTIPLYIGEAESFNNLNQFIHGGTGTFTREKIIVYNSKNILIIVDHTAELKDLFFNQTRISVEIIDVARTPVAREIINLKGLPCYRNNFITDNCNLILDITDLKIEHPIYLEETLNNIPGVLGNSIFSKKQANKIYTAIK